MLDTPRKAIDLRPAGPEQAAELAGLHARLFEPAWDAASFADLLANPAIRAILAWPVGALEPVGFAVVQRVLDEAEILSIGVAPEWQRRGVGGRLVSGLIARCRGEGGCRLTLEVAADNAAARRLYASLGCREVGRRRAYYTRPGANGEDALILALAM